MAEKYVQMICLKSPASDSLCIAVKVNSKPLPVLLPSETRVTIARLESISSGAGNTSPQILPTGKKVRPLAWLRIHTHTLCQAAYFFRFTKLYTILESHLFQGRL